MKIEHKKRFSQYGISLLAAFALCGSSAFSEPPPPPPTLAPPEGQEKMEALDPALNPALSEAKQFEDLGSSQSSEQEILPAPEFLEFSELDPLPEGLIEWSPNSARFLYLNQNELPYVYFMGKLKPGMELMFNDQFIQLEKDRAEFSIRVPLRLKPGIFRFRITDPKGKVVHFRLINYWLKLPSTFSYKIKNQAGVVEIGKSFYTRFEHSAFAQIYTGNRPASVIDLDAQKHAALTFRIYAPPKREEVYDGWELEIRTPRGRKVALVKRYGFPPAYIDWREVGLNELDRGEYTYRVNLIIRGKKYEGPENTFQTMEGLSIVKHDYFPTFVLEPRGEVGIFQFNNDRGLDYKNQYIAADINLVVKQRFLLRGFGLASVHDNNPSGTYAVARGGVGMRFFDTGYNRLGHPYLFRLDVTANYSAISISPESVVRRFSLATVLLEPHIVLWKYHYLSPTLELGTSLDMQAQKLTMGIGYEFYVRPWSVRVGMNVILDKLIRYSPRPDLAFTIFRTAASFTFFL